MPVIAKLSQRFYDRFGEDVVNELVELLNQVDTTFRSDIKEMNELNFARFDAKLEQRVAQLDAKIDQRTTQLDAKIDQRSALLESRMEQGFARLEAFVHRELRGQMRLMTGLVIGLWTSLLIPIVGLLAR